jgi:hypothetical protein
VDFPDIDEGPTNRNAPTGYPLGRRETTLTSQRFWLIWETLYSGGAG